MKTKKKKSLPDTDQTPQAEPNVAEMPDVTAQPDSAMTVDDILAEFHKEQRTSTPETVSSPDDPEAEVKTVQISSSDAPVVSPEEPLAAPERVSGAVKAEESSDAEMDAAEEFELPDEAELARSAAEAAEIKADIVGQFEPVGELYRDLGVTSAEPEEKSEESSMLKRWDLLSIFHRDHRKKPVSEGVSVSQLQEEDTSETEETGESAETPSDTAAVAPEQASKEAADAAPQPAQVDKWKAMMSRFPKWKVFSVSDKQPDMTAFSDSDADRDPAYAAQESPDSDPNPAATPNAGRTEPPRLSHFKASLTGYFISFFAAFAALRDKNGAAELDLSSQIPDPEEECPDIPAAGAAKLYGKQAQRIRSRALLATLLAVLLLAFSYCHLAGLPLIAGMGTNVRFMAMLCLLIQLLISLLGLDVFTTGLYNLIDGVPGMETLVSVSCIASAVDAFVIFLTKNASYGIPFCAVSSFSMVFALWGSFLYCVGYRLSFRTLAQIHTPMTLSSEPGLSEQGNTLLRSYGSTEHFIQRSEAPDLAESTYRLFTPLFLTVSLIFGFLSAVGHGQIRDFFHCFSACVSACAAFPAFLCFARPFASAAKKLRRKGCTIAGFTGCREVGSSSRIVITDEDVFPKGTVIVDKVITSNETLAKKLMIYTGSLLYESDSALTPAFSMLLTRNGYSKLTVHKFTHQEGGGFSGIINEEQVLVGTSAFLDLLGIRVPQRLKEQASVFTAINGQLAGAFCLKYNTTTASREAFASLFRSNHHPFFVARDFNVTPKLIQQHFGADPSQFEFPAFSDRYRISTAHAEKPAAAVLSKNEIGPLADCVSICYQLYAVTRRSVLLSLLGSLIGLLAAFVLCWLGAFHLISAATLTTFMLLWLIPPLLFSIKSRR